MLPAVFGLLAVLFGLLRVALRDRRDLVAENLLRRHQLAVLTRPTRRRPPTPSPARQAGLDPRPPPLPRLAAAPRLRPARDRRRLAPRGVAPRLVVALPLPARPTPAERR